MMQHPVLWSFRRCPYAIRARLAVQSAGIRVELREIQLRDKPAAFLATSPSASVPALRLRDQTPGDAQPDDSGSDGDVLDESLAIMVWALRQNDPDHLLDMPDAGWDLIAQNDGPFKSALDHTKYAVRYPDLDPQAERAKAAAFLTGLDARLNGQGWLFADRPTLADLALLPFVRQFANTDRPWFDAQPWPGLIAWLDRFLDSSSFAGVMTKYAPWTEGDAPVWFGAADPGAPRSLPQRA